MSVFIRGNGVRVASQSDNNGFFIGQNIQDNWDSISPMKIGAGFSMGDFSWMPAGYVAYIGRSFVGQPVFDVDYKDNWAESRLR